MIVARTRFKLKQRVYDRWWPARLGTIVRVTASTVRVQWIDGERWIYDRDHLQFLERYVVRRKRR